MTTQDPHTTTTDSDSRWLRTLDRAECLRLLAQESFGRIVTAMPSGAPVIRPVNYMFDRGSQSVLFRTAAGSKLHALLNTDQATFEIDGVDSDGRTGWSVIITGMVEEVTHPVELKRTSTLGVDTFMPEGKDRWLRVRAYTVSGREITLAAPAD